MFKAKDETDKPAYTSLSGNWLVKLMSKVHVLCNRIWGERRSLLLSEFALFAASTFLLQAARFGVNVLAAKLLGPATWGFWYLLNQVLIYGPNAHLGTVNGMNREVPVFKGKGDLVQVNLIRSSVLGFVLLTTTFTGIATSLWALIWSSPTVRGPLLHIVPLLMVTQVVLRQDLLELNCERLPDKTYDFALSVFRFYRHNKSLSFIPGFTR